MSGASTPWMKFYPQDWRADEKLRMCSLAARGLWMEMLAIMHRSERYGQLLIAGHIPTDAQLAVQVGSSPEEVAGLTAELSTAGVFSRTSGGAIYSRRMTRDQKKAENARKNGKQGGNPNLSKPKGNSGSDKGQDKASDKGGDNAQKPEARDQKPEAPLPPKPLDQPLNANLVAVMKASGMISPPPDAHLIREWLELPDMQMDRDIVPIIARVAQRKRETDNRPPFKLKLFDAAIREQCAADQAEGERLRNIAERFKAAEEDAKARREKA